MHSLGTGTDGITDSPYLGKDVIVTAVRGIHGAPISEMAFLMMLAFSRDFRRIERQRDDEDSGSAIPARCSTGKTVGILGVGAIAEGTGAALQGVRHAGRRHFADRPRRSPGFDKIYSRAEIVQAVAELDYFVLLVPLEDDTRNIVNDARAGRDEADGVS